MLWFTCWVWGVSSFFFSFKFVAVVGLQQCEMRLVAAAAKDCFIECGAPLAHSAIANTTLMLSLNHKNIKQKLILEVFIDIQQLAEANNSYLWNNK